MNNLRVLCLIGVFSGWVWGCGDDGGAGNTSGGTDVVSSGDSGLDNDGSGKDSQENADVVAGDALHGADMNLTDVGVADVSDTSTPAIANVVINEISHTSAATTPDWIELRNLDGITVNMAGWGIRDHLNAHEYLLPEGTTVPAFGYLLVWGKGANFPLTMDFDFDFDAKARLFDPSGTLVDTADWEAGDAPKGTSWGRWPDGTGDFVTLPIPSPGKTNVDPETVITPDTVDQDTAAGTDTETQDDISAEDASIQPDVTTPEDIVEVDVGVVEPPVPLIINEIYPSTTPGDFDWVELYNKGAEDLELGGYRVTNNSKDPFDTWDVLEGGTSIAPGQYLVLFAGDAGVNASFSFELSIPGNFVLAMPDGQFVGAVSWTADDVPSGKSFARIPDTTGKFQTADPTPEEPN